MKTVSLPETAAICGVALLEFVIGLVACFILIFGMVDAWKLLYEGQTVLTASEHGARTAAAVAHRLEVARDLPHACGEAGGSSDVLTAAVSLTFKYLVAVGLEDAACSPSGSPSRSCTGNSFTVSAQFNTVCEDAFPQRTVQVQVSANSPRRCIACFLPYFSDRVISASSTFAVEADCALLGGLSC